MYLYILDLELNNDLELIKELYNLKILCKY